MEQNQQNQPCRLRRVQNRLGPSSLQMTNDDQNQRDVRRRMIRMVICNNPVTDVPLIFVVVGTVLLSCSPALPLSCSPALLLSRSPALPLPCSPALLLSRSPALPLSCSPALPLSRSPALPLSCSPALPLSCSPALLLSR